MRSLVPTVAILLSLCGCAALAADADVPTLIPPPAINIPYGGIVVTEANLSDDNVLGLIKQAIPAVAEHAGSLIAHMVPAGHGPQAGGPTAAALLAALDPKGLVEAIQGIKAVRLIIAQYPRGMDAPTFLRQFDQGVAKLGNFSKVLSDIAFFPGAAGIYAEPENAGYMGFAYDPDSRVMYAVRIVGFVDVPKLINWAGNLVQAVIATRATRVPVPEAAPASPPDTDDKD